MKKALFISLIFHSFVFAADFSIGVITNKTLSAPVNPVRGFSVDVVHENSAPSASGGRYSILPDNLRKTIKPMPARQTAGQNRAAANLQRSSMAFSGSEYKHWLLEYYSLILKLIKTEMEKIGVPAGNIEIVIDIHRTGRINEVQILNSEYPQITESRIMHRVQTISLPALPSGFEENRLRLKLRVIYR